jgi:hypothetical protein
MGQPAAEALQESKRPFSGQWPEMQVTFCLAIASGQP